LGKSANRLSQLIHVVRSPFFKIPPSRCARKTTPPHKIDLNRTFYKPNCNLRVACHTRKRRKGEWGKEITANSRCAIRSEPKCPILRTACNLPISPAARLPIIGKVCQSRPCQAVDDENQEHSPSWMHSIFPGGETVRRRPLNGSPGLLHFLPSAFRAVAGCRNATGAVAVFLGCCRIARRVAKRPRRLTARHFGLYIPCTATGDTLFPRENMYQFRPRTVYVARFRRIQTHRDGKDCFDINHCRPICPTSSLP
jgi:hypothetical protein